MVIRGKGKFGYLDGSIPQPLTTKPSFSLWDIQNSMVMSWLIHSMEDHIVEIYLLYSTAQSIWDVVSLAYSDLEDTSQMFYLRSKARNLRQADDYVTTYFNSLKKLWQELDLFNQLNWKDPKDANIYRLMLACEWIYDSLARLNHSLDDVHGRIISTKPLSDLDEIFAQFFVITARIFRHGC